MSEKGDKLREAAMLADQEEELQEQQKEVLEDMKRAAELYKKSFIDPYGEFKEYHYDKYTKKAKKLYTDNYALDA